MHRMEKYFSTPDPLVTRVTLSTSTLKRWLTGLQPFRFRDEVRAFQEAWDKNWKPSFDQPKEGGFFKKTLGYE